MFGETALGAYRAFEGRPPGARRLLVYADLASPRPDWHKPFLDASP
jgi:hypothetical protein